MLNGHSTVMLATLFTALAAIGEGAKPTCTASAPSRFMHHPLAIRCSAEKGVLTYSIALQANDRPPVVTKELRITFRGSVKSVQAGPGWKWRQNDWSYSRTTEIVWERDPSAQASGENATQFVVVLSGSEAGLACPHSVKYEDEHGKNSGEMIGCPIA